MNRRVIIGATIGVFVLAFGGRTLAADLPEGYLPESESQLIIDKTLTIRLSPDLSALSDGERIAVGYLIEVGKIFERLHLHMRHHQALDGYEALIALDRKLGSPRATQNLMDLYYAGKGPIIRDLNGNRRVIFPADGYTPGRNAYAWGVQKVEIDAYIAENPSARRRLLDARSIVRRATKASAESDLAALDKYPALDALHPGLRDRIKAARSMDRVDAFYAVPHALAFAPELTETFRLLFLAADAIEAEDAEFAHYLRNRARDLLSNDYESGDASWVTGRFKNLNAQIGSYESYDDGLYGVKAFYGMNVLVRDPEKSEELRAAIGDIQSLENALPYQPTGWTDGNKKTVRPDIPVSIYNVVADFGQSRGSNTATILPNESEFARKYGRTILLRNNIMTHPQLFEMRLNAFRAALDEKHANDLTAAGGFYRTLWHEIGHYLGVDRTRDERTLDDALEQMASAYEEMKADLVSSYSGRALRRSGYYTDETLRQLYADGVRRVLLTRKPERSQPYQTMELMQFNYYIENGLLEFNAATRRLMIHYDRYHDVVAALLKAVLEIQYAGDIAAADEFMTRYTRWDDNLHGVLATAMRAAETYRYTSVTYEAADPIAR